MGTPVAIDVDGVLSRVGRRRSGRRLAVVAVSCAAVAGVGIGAYAVASSAPNATQSAAGPASVSATTDSNGGVLRLACGSRLSLHSSGTTTADGVVRLAISKVARGANGAVQVTITLSSSKRRSWPDPPGPTNPRFVIVRNGIVVAGQDIGPAPVSSAGPTLDVGPLHGATVDAQHPYSSLLDPLHQPGSVPVPCAGLTWDGLWRDGAKYQIVAFVSDRELGATPRTPGYGAGSTTPDPLLSVEEPLVTK